jgi:hypothetical protein
MYDTVRTNGEMTSNIKKATATEQIKKLTRHEKTYSDSGLHRHLNINTLPQSASNAASIDV